MVAHDDEPVTAGTIAVLADCHIHSGGPEFPKELLEALNGVDLIVTLGDMGDVAGLDQLAAIAPVVGVRGEDDAEDPRTAPKVRTLRLGKSVAACVFDAKLAGIASSAEPFTPAADWTAAAEKLFGVDADLVLHAATHRAEMKRIDGRLVVNPGSAVVPAEGWGRTFALLTIRDGQVDAEIVTVR
jgi:uncharacterized protein